MKKQLFFVALIFNCFLTFGQNFQWAKGLFSQTVQGKTMLVDPSGNVYSMGTYRNIGSSNTDFDPGPGNYSLSGEGSYIVKLNVSGKFLWAVGFPATANSIALDDKGNVYATGYFELKKDFDPGSGTFILNSEGGPDVFVLKLNASGNFVMAKKVGGKNHDYGSLIELDKSGHIYTSGNFSGLVDFDPGTPTYKITGSGSFKLELDSTGNFVSVKILKQQWKPFITDGKKNIYTTGSFAGKFDFDPDSANTFYLTSKGDNDVFVLKLDSLGKFIWAKSMGGVLTDIGNAIGVDASQNVYVTGSFEDSIDLDPGAGTFYLGSAGKTDVFVLKLDASGSFAWGKGFQGVDNESGNFLLLDDSSNIYMAGYFEDTVDFDPGTSKFNLVSAGNRDVFFAKMNSQGKFTWAGNVGGTDIEELTSMVLDKQKNIFSTGYFRNSVDFDPGKAKYNISSSGGYSAFILILGSCPSPTETISGPLSLCDGAVKATYSINPASGATGYKWSVPPGASIDSGQNTTKIKVTFGSTLGKISVVASNACDTGSYTPFIVTRNPSPNVIAQSSPSSGFVCKGNSVYLYGNGASTYTWSKGRINGSSFIPDSTDTYIVTGTDKNGCIGKDTITITIGVPPPASINGPSSVCRDNTHVTYFIDPVAGAKGYSWTVPPNATIDRGQNTLVIYVTFGPSSGSGYVAVIPTNSCNSNPTSMYVATSPAISLVINANPSPNVCKGDLVTFTATGSFNTLKWSGGIVNGQSFKPDSSLKYVVTATNNYGCKDMDSIYLKVNPLPTVTAHVLPATTVCKGTEMTLSGSGAVSYTWSGGKYNNIPFVLQTTGGSYVVTGTDANGCKDTASIKLTIQPLPVLNKQPVSKNVNEGASTTFVTTCNSPTATYQWQWQRTAFPSGPVMDLNNDNQFSGVQTDTLTILNVSTELKNYSFSCMVNDNGCSTSSSKATITVITAAINSQLKTMGIHVFPNPVKQLMTVELDQSPVNLPYAITDQTGRQILTGTLNNKTTTHDISALSPGFYFLQMGVLNKTTFKIVKQ